MSEMEIFQHLSLLITTRLVNLGQQDGLKKA